MWNNQSNPVQQNLIILHLNKETVLNMASRLIKNIFEKQ